MYKDAINKAKRIFSFLTFGKFRRHVQAFQNYHFSKQLLNILGKNVIGYNFHGWRNLRQVERLRRGTLIFGVRKNCDLGHCSYNILLMLRTKSILLNIMTFLRELANVEIMYIFL